jgi:hypothetical protein
MRNRDSRQAGPARRRFAAIALVAAVGVTALPGIAGASHASLVAQAKKGLLVLQDMPKGWTSSAGSGGGGGDFPGASQLASCIGVAKSVITANPPTANSKEFDSKNQYQSVNDSVAIYPSVKDAQAQVTAFANAKTPDCMAALVNTAASKKQIASEVGSGATVGNITAAAGPASAFAKGTAALSLDVPVVDQGVTVPLHLTLVVGVKGKEAYQLTLTSVGTTFPSSLSKRLTTLSAKRI